LIDLTSQPGLLNYSCSPFYTCISSMTQCLNCPATGGGSLSLKLLDNTFVRLGEKFRTSIKHPIPPRTRKVCFCSQLCDVVLDGWKVETS